MPRDIGTGLYRYPDGTPGIPGQTVFSARYNTFIDDLKNSLNQPLPINMGGTGGDSGTAATTNLKAVSYGGAQTLTDAEKLVARTNIAAVPFDAMAYSGMQVNGSMEVTQEIVPGTNVSASNAYICDGWSVGFAGAGVMSVSTNLSFTPGIIWMLRSAIATPVASPAAGDIMSVTHRIEGYRTARLQWGTATALPITIGFWVKNVRAGTYSIAVRNLASDRSYVTSYTQTVADTPEYKTITIPGCTDGVWPTNNTVGLQITFTQMCGTTRQTPTPNAWAAGNFAAVPTQVNAATASDIMRITGVVVLPGTQAPTAAQSPLIMRPYDQELVTCQRYFYKLNYPIGTFICTLQAYSSTAASGKVFDFPVTMRASPAIAGAGTFTLTGSSGVGVVIGGGSYVSTPDMFQINSASVGAATFNNGDATLLGASAASSHSCDARL